MNKLMIAIASTTLVLGAGISQAKVSESEALKLGNELTPMGAERAGNAAGTIPPWSGGMTTPPAGYQGEGNTRIDPFADEKPLFSINSSNYKDYADNLTVGQKALFERYPDFKMHIYPSHRTAAAPQWVYDNVKTNALNATLTEGGNGVQNAFGGVPFPIPQNGNEAIWNHNLYWKGEGDRKDYRYTVVYPNGEKSVGGGVAWAQYPYYSQDQSASTYNGNVFQLFIIYDAPVRRKGEVLLVRDPVNISNSPRQAWQYIPGQRRVRRAPTVAFDTPNTQFAGQSTYDDTYMFNGSTERYDWKLIGKKEMYILYNSNGLIAATHEGNIEDIETPNFPNPEYARYELHRVWVVQATLAEGQRHVYGKRTFYLDEDTWAIVATDIYDGRGDLWRVGFSNMLNAYDVPATLQRFYWHVDFQNGAWTVNEVDRSPHRIYKGEEENFFTPSQVRKMSRR